MLGAAADGFSALGPSPMLKLYRSRWKGESGAGGCNGAVLVEGGRPESGSASLPPAIVATTV